MDTQQAIIELDATTDFDNMPASFKGMAQLLGLGSISMGQMPATRTFNGRMLAHFSCKQVEGITDILQMLCTNIGNWSLKASQTKLAHPQYDELGNPVMIESGYWDGQGVPIMEHQRKANVDIPLSKSYFLDFMHDVPDTVDAEGNVLTWKRPTEVSVHKYVGAEDWELTV